MPVQVAFVAAVGRVSQGSLSALARLQEICGKYRGRIVTQGDGSSTAPIIAEFLDEPSAVAAAQDAFYLDDIEYAKVLTSTVGQTVQNNGPVSIPSAGVDTVGSSVPTAQAGVKESITSVDQAIQAVVGGADVKDVVRQFIAHRKAALAK